MIISVGCDECGKVLLMDQVYGDRDSVHYCQRDWVKLQLQETKDAYEKKKKWLELTHLADLQKLETRISDLQNTLINLEDDHV